MLSAGGKEVKHHLKQIIYVDRIIALATANFVFDYLLLWATDQVVKLGARPVRLILAASLGAAYAVFYQLSIYRVIPYYAVLSSLPMILTVSLVMIFTAFQHLTRQLLVRTLAHFYLILFLAGGAGIGLGLYLFHSSLLGMVASIVTLLVVAELGWGIVQKQIWEHIYKIPIHISIVGQAIDVIALVDTGNQLRDPLTSSPVVIVESSALKPVLPENILDLIHSIGNGAMDGVSSLMAEEGWSSRFRIIPFASIGKSRGLLVGFRADRVTATIDGRRLQAGNVIIAVYDGQLSADENYQALIHPQLLETELVRPKQKTGLSISARAGSSQH